MKLLNKLFETQRGAEYPERIVEEEALLDEAEKHGIQGEFSKEEYGYKQVNGEYLNFWVREDWEGPMPWKGLIF